MKELNNIELNNISGGCIISRYIYKFIIKTFRLFFKPTFM